MNRVTERIARWGEATLLVLGHTCSGGRVKGVVGRDGSEAMNDSAVVSRECEGKTRCRDAAG